MAKIPARVLQVEQNRGEAIRAGAEAEVASVLASWGLQRMAASPWAAAALQKAIVQRRCWRPERFDLTAGKREMLRMPRQAARSGGDCDDWTLFCGLAWRVLTGADPFGCRWLPSIEKAEHVCLEAMPGVTIDVAPGAPESWGEQGEVTLW